MFRPLWRWLLRHKDPPAAAEVERSEQKIQELRHETRNIQARIGPLARLLLEMERSLRQQQGERDDKAGHNRRG